MILILVSLSGCSGNDSSEDENQITPDQNEQDTAENIGQENAAESIDATLLMNFSDYSWIDAIEVGGPLHLRIQ